MPVELELDLNVKVIVDRRTMVKTLAIAPNEDAKVSVRPQLRIGDLAKRINKTTRAVRLYEEMGLLGEVHRTEGGQRVYSEDVLVRLLWIEKLQGLSFTLPQIKDLLCEWTDNRYGPDGMQRLREIYQSKLEETQVQIRQLQSLTGDLTDSLNYLASCEVCDPCTLLGACSDCTYPHSSSARPELVAGLYSVPPPSRMQGAEKNDHEK